MAQASVEEGRTGNRPDRNLALELVRVTEAAALGLAFIQRDYAKRIADADH